jgi:hypothetical protein
MPVEFSRTNRVAESVEDWPRVRHWRDCSGFQPHPSCADNPGWANWYHDQFLGLHQSYMVGSSPTALFTSQLTISSNAECAIGLLCACIPLMPALWADTMGSASRYRHSRRSSHRYTFKSDTEGGMSLSQQLTPVSSTRPASFGYDYGYGRTSPELMSRPYLLTPDGYGSDQTSLIGPPPSVITVVQSHYGPTPGRTTPEMWADFCRSRPPRTPSPLNESPSEDTTIMRTVEISQAYESPPEEVGRSTYLARPLAR